MRQASDLLEHHFLCLFYRYKLLKKVKNLFKMKSLFFCLEHVSVCFRTISIMQTILYDKYVNGYITCEWPITAVKYFI